MLLHLRVNQLDLINVIFFYYPYIFTVHLLSQFYTDIWHIQCLKIYSPNAAYCWSDCVLHPTEGLFVCPSCDRAHRFTPCLPLIWVHTRCCLGKNSFPRVHFQTEMFALPKHYRLNSKTTSKLNTRETQNSLSQSSVKQNTLKFSPSKQKNCFTYLLTFLQI